jgi:hypothetical protein
VGEQPDDRRNPDSWFAKIKDKGEFVFSFVLMVYGVFGYYVVREQMEIMWLQTAIMQNQMLDAERDERRSREDLERSFRIAESQSNALKSLADSYAQTLRALQRAHLSITGGSFPLDPTSATHPVEQKAPLMARIVLSGDRSTPARDVTVSALAEVLSRDQAPRWERGKVILRGGTVGSVFVTLRPEFVTRAGTAVGPLTPALIGELRTGKKKLVVHGRATYRDHLGGCFWNTFCFIYLAPPTTAESTEWLPCSRHNDEGECGAGSTP